MAKDVGPVRLAHVRIDGGTQPRAAIAEDVVSDYAEAMTEGAEFPPIDVFFDGVDYWLADGFHRYHAGKKLGLVEVPAKIHAGTRREAVLFSVGVNQGHGLRRTHADKRKAVLTLLSDAEWGGWSDRDIARRCGVGHQMVGTLRPKSSLDDSSSDKGASRSYTTKHGTEAKMNVEHIGRKPGGQKAVAQADREARVAMAIEGASQSSLRRMPRKEDAEVVVNTVNALRGLIGALARIDIAALADDPRAVEWRGAIDEAIGVLRAFNRQLPQQAERAS